jgi:2-oxo-4-hydroxy-4-carboxy-5-ureidoimidazoline decarboxylase
MTLAKHPVLERWNSLDPALAAREILPCCGSTAWAAELAARRPISDGDHLLIQSDAVWFGLPESAWQEAFDSHPRIGQQKAKSATETSLAWSATEQSVAQSGNTPADEQAKLRLAEGNRRYEEKFGRIFIVCASGKSRREILDLLETRMNNDAVTELHAAAEQQREITQLRLQRWLGGQ